MQHKVGDGRGVLRKDAGRDTAYAAERVQGAGQALQEGRAVRVQALDQVRAQRPQQGGMLPGRHQARERPAFDDGTSSSQNPKT